MRYTTAIEIKKPRNVVIELFDSVENMYQWQPTLVSVEPLSGEPGMEGSRSRLTYRMGKRDVVMIETITKRNLPDEFSGTYEAKGVFNLQQNYFDALDEDTTQWTSVSEFNCSGFMKLICALMPWTFRKQTLKIMEQFRDFAEKS